MYSYVFKADTELYRNVVLWSLCCLFYQITLQLCTTEDMVPFCYEEISFFTGFHLICEPFNINIFHVHLLWHNTSAAPFPCHLDTQTTTWSKYITHFSVKICSETSIKCNLLDNSIYLWTFYLWSIWNKFLF